MRPLADIKVGIISTDKAYCSHLRAMLLQQSDIAVSWEQHEIATAIQSAQSKQVDIILIDCSSRILDCVRITELLKAASNSIILLVTTESGRNTASVFNAMGAGAMDILTYPGPKEVFTDSMLNTFRRFFMEKLNTIRKLVKKNPGATRAERPVMLPVNNDKVPLVVIGSSTGGPTALAKILAQLPAKFPAAIIIVQHVNEQFVQNLADWLDDNTALQVRLAQRGDKPQAGQVLLAAKHDHLYLRPDQTLAYTPEPEDYPYRPSVDVFFGSVAQHWNADVIGVLLTGMGRDGAKGLLALRQKGYRTIAQNKSSCTVFGMPKAAIELDAADLVLDIAEISKEICASFDYMSRRKIK